MQRAIDSGVVCVECGSEFTEAHGFKAACTYCWSRLTLAEQREIRKATHEERNVRAIVSVARARKAAKAKRNAE
jgi:DNA-directed RNA polymerase subunit RPC12/RpoP